VSSTLDSPPAYLEFAPPPELRPYIERLWMHRIEDPRHRLAGLTPAQLRGWQH
jgi:hypothetical protein